MNPETTCCFTGPRPAKLPMNGNEYSAEIAALKTNIRSAVIDAYNEGFRFFMNGMAEGFDLFAAEIVLGLRDELPGIALVAVLPYSGACLGHSASIRERMEKVLKNAEAVFSLSENYEKGCEHSRNSYMVENSTRIIGFYNGLSGGTAHCWNCALRKGIETVNLYESF
ncbi:MAG: DUF1273 family protein [Oscillospiraceae bacterium]|nr:DUF1273 family protein [Oscillospiraceae bacterium]